MEQDQPLYLEDLAAGQTFSTGSHEIDAAQIIAFARQFDPQPFHLDPEKAQQTFFKSLAASGWHTASITMRLLVESGFPLAGGIIGTEAKLKWPRPTRAGDILTAIGEITEVRPSKSRPDRGWVEIRTETRNSMIRSCRSSLPRSLYSAAQRHRGHLWPGSLLLNLMGGPGGIGE